MSSVRGDPQNSGNLLPSRPSTKLHAPPGGQSSISLSWDAPPESQPQHQPQQPETVAPVVPESHDPPTTGKGVSSNAFANGMNQNCGNVLTDRPTTRLHAPPGGRSSITLG